MNNVRHVILKYHGFSGARKDQTQLHSMRKHDGIGSLELHGTIDIGAVAAAQVCDSDAAGDALNKSMLRRNTGVIQLDPSEAWCSSKYEFRLLWSQARYFDMPTTPTRNQLCFDDRPCNQTVNSHQRTGNKSTCGIAAFKETRRMLGLEAISRKLWTVLWRCTSANNSHRLLQHFELR